MVSDLGKKFGLLLFANILWGFIPWPAAELFASYSLFIVVLLRFLEGGILLMVTAFIMTLYMNHKSNKERIIFGVKNFKDYLQAKNKDFFNAPQWLYLIIIALIGFNGMIVLFFIGLKMLGAIVTSIGFLIGLFVCTIINWGLGKEGMSNFKILYLFTLIVGAIILGLANQYQDSTGSSGGTNLISALSWEGFLVTIFYGVTYAFFLVTSSTDRLTNSELHIKRIEPRYEVLRTCWKTGLIMIIAAVILIPQLWLLQLLPLPSNILLEINNFFFQLPNIGQLLFLPNTLLLTVVCTVSPFLLFYFLGVVWPKTSSFDLWAGILSIAEPMVNMILGITVLQEPFPITWLTVVMILMGIAIIMRYLSESETQVNAVLLVKLKFNHDREAMMYAYHMSGVKTVKFLLGDWDLMIVIQSNSQKSLNFLIGTELGKMPGLDQYKLLNILETNLDNTLTESWGITKISLEDKNQNHKNREFTK
jgi:drug/metabolite transporter (DMT)-like permease